jgi:DNA-binding NarL/FixJ family response regulator
MAVSAPELDGLQTTRRLVARDPRANVVMLTSEEDDETTVANALSGGARGFLTSDASLEELCAAVAHALGAGAAPLEVPVLTERERQVLTGMSRGRSNGEIGRELYLSEDTVKTHARRLFRKLGVNDRAQAVALGFRMGLVR